MSKIYYKLRTTKTQVFNLLTIASRIKKIFIYINIKILIFNFNFLDKEIKINLLDMDVIKIIFIANTNFIAIIYCS